MPRRLQTHQPARWPDLRHEYAPRLVEKNVPLAQVRDLLGHTSITTTERYDNQKLENLQAAARLERGETFDPSPRESAPPSICQVFVKSSADQAPHGNTDRLSEAATNSQDDQDLADWLGARWHRGLQSLAVVDDQIGDGSVAPNLPTGFAGRKRLPLHAIVPAFLSASTRSRTEIASGMMRATGWPCSVMTMVRPDLTSRTHSLSVDFRSRIPIRFSRMLLRPHYPKCGRTGRRRQSLSGRDRQLGLRVSVSSQDQERIVSGAVRAGCRHRDSRELPARARIDLQLANEPHRCRGAAIKSPTASRDRRALLWEAWIPLSPQSILGNGLPRLPVNDAFVVEHTRVLISPSLSCAVERHM